jgi:hypothetical protein
VFLGNLATAATPRTFTADISKQAPESSFQNDVLTKCFGSSHASTALRYSISLTWANHLIKKIAFSPIIEPTGKPS